MECHVLSYCALPSSRRDSPVGFIGACSIEMYESQGHAMQVTFGKEASSIETIYFSYAAAWENTLCILVGFSKQ